MNKLSLVLGAGLLSLGLTAPPVIAGNQGYFSVRISDVPPYHARNSGYYRHHRGYYRQLHYRPVGHQPYRHDLGHDYGNYRRSHHRWPRYRPWYDPRDYRHDHGKRGNHREHDNYSHSSWVIQYSYYD